MATVQLPYKQEVPFEERRDEANRVREKYVDRLPVIAEKHAGADLPVIDKRKYLVPLELTVGQFIYVIRKRIHLTPESSLYVFVNKQLLTTATPMSEVYERYKDSDGFLYVTYSSEKSFGSDE